MFVGDLCPIRHVRGKGIRLRLRALRRFWVVAVVVAMISLGLFVYLILSYNNNRNVAEASLSRSDTLVLAIGFGSASFSTFVSAVMGYFSARELNEQSAVNQELAKERIQIYRQIYQYSADYLGGKDGSAHDFSNDLQKLTQSQNSFLFCSKKVQVELRNLEGVYHQGKMRFFDRRVERLKKVIQEEMQH
jgi:hypothetical protein